MSSRRLSAVLTTCLLAAASLTLAACGGGGGSNTTAERLQDERKQVQFTKCMREHGLNVTAPTNSTGEIRITGSAKGAGLQTLEAAQNACKKYRPKSPAQNLTPAERAQRQDAVLKFAQCMRSHGVNVPNPTTEGGGIGIRIKGGLGKINPESPTFQAAQKACQGLLPKFGRRGPRGLGGGPSTQSSDGGAGGPKSGAALSIGPVTKAGG